MKNALKSRKNDHTRKGNGATLFDDESAFYAAYERRLREIEAVPEAELLQVNLDVEAAVTTILGTLPKVGELRDQMSKLLSFDMKLVDGLEDYAQAAGEANSRYLIAVAPPEDLVKLNEQALALREMLRSDALALVNRKLISKDRIASFTGRVGYRNVAFELMDWANVFRDCWKAVQGKTAVTADEVQNAKALAEKIIRAVGQKEQAPAAAAEAAEVRQRAFTLMVKAYDQTRRGVAFLRWEEGDIELITPSLYAGRGGRGKRPEPPPSPGPAPTPNPPAPSPEPPVVNPPQAGDAPMPGTPGGSRVTAE